MKWVILSEELRFFGYNKVIRIKDSEEEAKKVANDLTKYLKNEFKVLDILSVSDYEAKYGKIRTIPRRELQLSKRKKK